MYVPRAKKDCAVRDDEWVCCLKAKGFIVRVKIIKTMFMCLRLRPRARPLVIVEEGKSFFVSSACVHGQHNQDANPTTNTSADDHG